MAKIAAIICLLALSESDPIVMYTLHMVVVRRITHSLCPICAILLSSNNLVTRTLKPLHICHHDNNQNLLLLNIAKLRLLIQIKCQRANIKFFPQEHSKAKLNLAYRGNSSSNHSNNRTITQRQITQK